MKLFIAFDFLSLLLCFGWAHHSGPFESLDLLFHLELHSAVSLSLCSLRLFNSFLRLSLLPSYDIIWLYFLSLHWFNRTSKWCLPWMMTLSGTYSNSQTMSHFKAAVLRGLSLSKITQSSSCHTQRLSWRTFQLSRVFAWTDFGSHWWGCSSTLYSYLFPR
jgi:hypothetical protein